MTARDGDLTDADAAALYAKGIEYVGFLPNEPGGPVWLVRDCIGDRHLTPDELARLLSN